MIDTITLRLTESQFKIVDYNKFSPNCQNFYCPPYVRFGSRGYADAYQNPTKKEMLAGNYKPQLTLRKTWRTHQALIYLFVQFSAPKLLLGNNFDELTDDDLEAVLRELKMKLAEMAVFTSVADLKRASVVKIHYGKNIVLPDYFIPSIILGEIRKADFNQQNDLCEKDYRNSGHSVRFHNSEFELIFYDKKKDLQKAKNSDKRSIEQDNAIQLNIFDILKPKKPFEVLRIEARLNTSKRIARELKLDKSEQTIVNLFSQKKSVKVLTNCWQTIAENYQLLGCKIEDKEKFLAAFMANNSKARLTTALSTYAFIEYIKEMGINRFRGLIGKKYTRRTWYGIKSSISKLHLNAEIPKYFDSISKVLVGYKPLRLADYKDAFND